MSAGSQNEIAREEIQAEQERRKTIVVAEDDVSNADMLQLLLQSETSYHLVQFTNEEELLQRIDDIKALNPALFLFDYRLSSMTALDLYDQLQSVEELQQVPALVLTAGVVNNEEEFVRRNIPIIQKPFDVDDLLHVINQLIG